MKLRTWIKKNDKTIRGVAKEMGIGYTSIAKYCTGDRRPKYETAVKIEKFTKGQVTVKDLMKK